MQRRHVKLGLCRPKDPKGAQLGVCPQQPINACDAVHSPSTFSNTWKVRIVESEGWGGSIYSLIRSEELKAGDSGSDICTWVLLSAQPLTQG